MQGVSVLGEAGASVQLRISRSTNGIKFFLARGPLDNGTAWLRTFNVLPPDTQLMSCVQMPTVWQEVASFRQLEVESGFVRGKLLHLKRVAQPFLADDFGPVT